MADKVAAIGHNTQQAILLQSQRGLPHGCPARLISFGEILLRERFTSRVDAADDIPLESLVNFLTELVADGAYVGGPVAFLTDNFHHSASVFPFSGDARKKTIT